MKILLGVTSLVVQWLRRHSQCRGPSSIPGQGTRSCMPQLRVHMPQVLHAATKTWQSQINELKPEQAGIVTEGKFRSVCVDCLYL